MKKAAIQPVTCYVNGKQMIATHISVVSVKDDLFSHVIFRYTLWDANGQHAGEAAYELNGVEAYSQWDASAEGAYQIVCNAIGVQFANPLLGTESFFEV